MSSPPKITDPYLRTCTNEYLRVGGQSIRFPFGRKKCRSDSLHRNDFHLEGDVLARQRVIEVDFHGVVVDGLDHAGHFTTGGVAEDDQQAVLQDRKSTRLNSS